MINKQMVIIENLQAFLGAVNLSFPKTMQVGTFHAQY